MTEEDNDVLWKPGEEGGWLSGDDALPFILTHSLVALCMGISRSVEGMDRLMSVPLKISERRHHSSVRVCIVAYLFKIN